MPVGGRPPLAASSPGDDEENNEAEEGQEYEEGHENYEGEEQPAEGEGEEGEEKADEESDAGIDDNEEVTEYVPPPEEKPFPPFFTINLAGIVAVDGDDHNNAKSNSDERKLILPSASSGDPRFPKWLHYILNDDFPSLSYLIHPPPGAEIDYSKHAGKDAKRGGADGDNNEEEEHEEREESANSRPSSAGHHSRGGESEVDSEGNPKRGDHDGSGQNQTEDTPFHPNVKFVLIPSEENPNTTWHLVPYDLPKPPLYKNGGDGAGRPDSQLSGNESARSGADSHVTGDAGLDGTQNRDNSDNNNATGNNNNNNSNEDADGSQGGVIVDVLVLAALFSHEALAMCIRERKRSLKNDIEDQKPPVYDEDGRLVQQGVDENEGNAAPEAAEEEEDQDLDEDTKMRRKFSPPSLLCFWKFCEKYDKNGLYNNSCQPLLKLIEAQMHWQDSDEPDRKKHKKPVKKAKKVIDQETGEEYAEEENPDEEAAREREAAEDAFFARQSRGQNRRLFLDYSRLFDLIATAPSTAAAQFLEATMRNMIRDANISPNATIDMQRRALKNLNTLQAYVTFLVYIPRSVVVEHTAAWLEPVPLTEEEISAYPEGAENIPEEHPPKIPRALWNVFQQVRRRTAKESKAKDAPKRPLLEVIKKFFTPQAQHSDPEQQQLLKNNPNPNAAAVRTAPVIYSDKAQPTFDEEYDDAAKSIDPLLSKPETFDAGRDYLPNKLDVYLSDIVLVLLSRHAFAKDSFVWLGSLKRDYPHSKWDAVASSHILAFSLNRMEPVCALATVTSLLNVSWLAGHHDRIDIASFIAEVVAESASAARPLDNENSFARSASTLEAFARRFARAFFCVGKDRFHLENGNENNNNNDNVPCAHLVSVKKQNSELYQLLMRIEVQRQEFEQFIQDDAAFSAAALNSRTELAKLEEKINCFSHTLGFESSIATAKMLRVAVDAKNVMATRFLIKVGGVTRVIHERGDIPVLEYAVESKNEKIVVALVQDYANIKEPLRGGQRDIFGAIQECFVPPPDAKRIFSFNDHDEVATSHKHNAAPAYFDIEAAVKRVEAAILEAQAKRGADPTQLLGIRTGSKV